MAYGDSRRLKAEQNFGFLSVFGLGGAASVGIGIAVLVDLLQQREASALFVINRWMLEVTSLLGLETIPLYCIMLILMAIGGMSVLFFQPVTFRGAFTQGFGVLAALVTIAPSDLGVPLDGPEQAMFELRPSETLEPASLTMAAVQRRDDTYNLRIQVVFPEGMKSDFRTMVRRNHLTGRMHDSATGQTYNLFRNTGAKVEYEGGVMRIEAQIHGDARQTRLLARIEADGYVINESSFQARQGANPVWSITMAPSEQPLFLQRLRHSYTF
ncbi:MAG: hypothetical protein AAF788_01695 [Pseudomonadota bacterium]